MHKFLKALILIIISFNRVYSHQNTILVDDSNSVELEKTKENIEVRSAVANFRALTSLFFKRGLKLNPEDEAANRIVDDMIVAAKNIIELVRTQKHAEQFVSMQGFETVIAPMLGIKRADLKTLLLTLTRDLFRKSAEAMSDVVSAKYVDKLIDIMENEGGTNQVLCLDIVSDWLPGNVDVQTRVIRYKGLRPFYQLLSQLKPESLRALLELFTKIIREHKSALDKDAVINETLLEKYQRMGLLQLIAHRESCYALLEIFEKSPPLEQESVLVPVYQLLREVRPLCADYYRENPRVVSVCKTLLEYFSDVGRQERLKMIVNVTDAAVVLTGCVLPTGKDEL